MYDQIEDQVSMTVDNFEILAADSESESESESTSSPSLHFGAGAIRIDEENNEHRIIKNCFLMGMGQFGKDTEVVAIHRNSCSSLSGQARFEAFRIFSEAVAEKCGGNANIRFSWYGGSRDEIANIVSHGFAHCQQSENRGLLHGHGVYLSPAKFSMDGALTSDVDENGFRHIILCRVILGKMEQISARSEQFHPSSEEFDSGVDNISDPKRYIIWSSYMNSHILPSYIISFKAPSPVLDMPRNQRSSLIPKSPYMIFPHLMSMLAKYLGPSQMNLIAKYYTAFRENKITRPQMIRKVREIAGDELLRTVIKLRCPSLRQGKARK